MKTEWVTATPGHQDCLCWQTAWAGIRRARLQPSWRWTPFPAFTKDKLSRSSAILLNFWPVPPWPPTTASFGMQRKKACLTPRARRLWRPLCKMPRQPGCIAEIRGYMWCAMASCCYAPRTIHLLSRRAKHRGRPRQLTETSCLPALGRLPSLRWRQQAPWLCGKATS